MRLCELCSATRTGFASIRNQPDFIDALFAAAAGKKVCISDSYKKKLYTGKEEFSTKLKGEWRKIDNLDSLTSFFDSMAEESLPEVVANLGIPEKGKPNKHALSVSLAVQMKAMIDSDEDDAPDMVVMEYQRQCTEPDASPKDIPKPLYLGDELYVYAYKPYEINSTDVFQHTWEIENRGTQTWTGRKLVYLRDPKRDRPEANPDVISIPTVKPKQTIKITTTFDGRGFDGEFHCQWEMQNQDGENCFRGRSQAFCVIIKAKYKWS